MLTWTLMMAKHSPVIAEEYIENNSPDKLIEMRLLTREEFEKLSENDGTSMLWSDNWWVPMTWNMLLVNKEMNENGHLPRYQIYMIFQPAAFYFYAIIDIFCRHTIQCFLINNSIPPYI